MLGSAPRFPALHIWQNMSESEQDALIAKIEAARRRRPLAIRLAIFLAGIGLLAASGVALFDR